MSTALELRIAPARREDCSVVAALHARAFPDAAMTGFGLEAVRRYYLWLLEGPHDGKLMLAWRGSRLVGFCAAGIFRQAVRGFLRTNVAFLAGRILRHPTLLSNELIRARMAHAIRVLLRLPLAVEPVEPAPLARGVRPFGVLSIATDPAVRGSGAGRRLMLEAEDRARREGFDLMVLSVHPTNVDAIGFYELLGWKRGVPADGRWRGYMEKLVTPARTV
ncbi:MAG TPA: GNAT family N-acetyltransferase [Kofleriaceae bacterium]|jgi:ribosomal protein S18 acetylase RimI-like enzyme